ncbi:MAG TPA: PGPGW domain-containing protein [Candidatus Saccharimonadales bacterium]|nr:PGPGW domain-containing protein [Candidatus Saccharimonadales bacterium]
MERLKKSWRKIAIAAIGFPVMAVGVALLVLPGPGLLVIAAGLAILSLEFEFADRHLKSVRRRLEELPKKVRRRKNT